jgi:hypothetical protein
MSEGRKIDARYFDIPIGRESSISRKTLAALWGVNDRKARAIVAALRADDNGDGYVIVSHSSGKGYYRTSNPDEIEHFIRETTKRAANTFGLLKKARRILRSSGKGL